MMSLIVLLWLHFSHEAPPVQPMALDAAVQRALSSGTEAQLEGLMGMAFVFPSAKQGWTASVVVRVPNFAGISEKGYLLAIAAFNASGTTLDATQFDLPAGAINKPLLLYEVLQTDAPITKVAWYLRDNDSKAFTVQSVTDLPREGDLSSLLLSPGLAGTLAPLNQNRGDAGKGRQGLDPLVIDDGLFPLFPATAFNAPETLYLFFTLSDRGDDPANFTFTLQIEDGKEAFAAPLFEVQHLPESQPGRTRFFGSFDTLGFTSGKYTAVLTVTTRDGGKRHERRQEFEIVWQ